MAKPLKLASKVCRPDFRRQFLSEIQTRWSPDFAVFWISSIRILALQCTLGLSAH